MHFIIPVNCTRNEWDAYIRIPCALPVDIDYKQPPIRELCSVYLPKLPVTLLRLHTFAKSHCVKGGSANRRQSALLAATFRYKTTYKVMICILMHAMPCAHYYVCVQSIIFKEMHYTNYILTT